MEGKNPEALAFNDPRFVIRTLPKFLQIILHVMGYSKDKILALAEFDKNFKKEMSEAAFELLEETSSLTRTDFVEALLEVRLDPDSFKLYSGHFLEVKSAQDTIMEQNELFAY